MRRALAVSLLFGIAATGFAPTAAGSDASRGEDLLKSKHLRREKGTYLLVVAEDEALEKLTGFRDAHTAFVKAQGRVTAYDQNEQMLKATTTELAGVTRMMASLRGRAGNLPRRHSAMQAQQHQEARYELQEAQAYHGQLQAQSEQLKRGQPKEEEKKTAAADLKQAKDMLLGEFRTAKDALDPVADAYRELAQDKDVRLALEAIRIESKAPAKLGPSRKFLDAVKLVEGSKAAGQLSSMKNLAKGRAGARP